MSVLCFLYWSRSIFYSFFILFDFSIELDVPCLDLEQHLFCKNMNFVFRFFLFTSFVLIVIFWYLLPYAVRVCGFDSFPFVRVRSLLYGLMLILCVVALCNDSIHLILV